jgi:putative transposase
VTVCVHDRNRLFGDIVDGKMITNDYGEIVIQIWKSLLQMGIRLDVFQIMPDHFHGIIIIDRSHVGVSFMKPSELTLGQIIRHFKAKCSYEIHKTGLNDKIWQRNYYEHIIRSEKELHSIRKYILDNPVGFHL